MAHLPVVMTFVIAHCSVAVVAGGFIITHAALRAPASPALMSIASRAASTIARGIIAFTQFHAREPLILRHPEPTVGMFASVVVALLDDLQPAGDRPVNSLMDKVFKSTRL